MLIKGKRENGAENIENKKPLSQKLLTKNLTL
jgi:hypothetical protein